MFRLEISTIDSNAEVTFTEPAQLYATLEEANLAAAKAFDEVRNVVTIEVIEVPADKPSLKLVGSDL